MEHLYDERTGTYCGLFAPFVALHPEIIEALELAYKKGKHDGINLRVDQEAVRERARISQEEADRAKRMKNEREALRAERRKRLLGLEHFTEVYNEDFLHELYELGEDE